MTNNFSDAATLCPRRLGTVPFRGRCGVLGGRISGSIVLSSALVLISLILAPPPPCTAQNLDPAQLTMNMAEDAVTVYVIGLAGAELVINDRDRFTLPLAAPLRLAPGHHRLVCTHRGYMPYEETLTIVADDQIRYVQPRLIRYDRSTAWTSNLLFAGLGQHYLDQRSKGLFFNMAEATGLVTAIVGEARRNNSRDDYLLLMDRYNSAIDADEIARYQSQANAAYAQMEDAERLRNKGLQLAVAAIAVSIIDAVLFFPSVKTGTGAVPQEIGALDGGGGAAGAQASRFQAADKALQSFHAAVVVPF